MDSLQIQRSDTTKGLSIQLTSVQSNNLPSKKLKQYTWLHYKLLQSNSNQQLTRSHHIKALYIGSL
jgi:hypothetical protein